MVTHAHNAYDDDRNAVMERVALLGTSEPGACLAYASTLGHYLIVVGPDLVIRSFHTAPDGKQASKDEARIARKGNRSYLKFDV